jgi:hypothetical protein
MIYSRHMVLLINDTETYVETCVSFKLSKLLNKEHVEVFTQTIHFLPIIFLLVLSEGTIFESCTDSFIVQ